MTKPLLTKRESEVLRLFAQGMTSREASEALFVSKRCIDWHAQSAYQKLGVHTRIKAINAAIRQGLL
jgi:DNA-binding NarL/FixJ family response regulator